MQRSVSETRRSVATRPKRSTRGCITPRIGPARQPPVGARVGPHYGGAVREWLASWRFLLSRRWLLFFLAILVLGYGTWWLGEWQFGRLDDREDRNAVIEANAHEDPVPVGDVLAPGDPVAETEEYTVVEATGTYDVDDTLIVRYRTRDGAPGSRRRRTPRDGRRDRARRRPWLAGVRRTPGRRDRRGAGATGGRGHHHRLGPGRRRGREHRGVRRRDAGDLQRPQSATPSISRCTAGSWSCCPRTRHPAESLEPAEEPDTGEGPHFFYGLQWWFFGLLAVGGCGYLAWDERKNGPRGERRQSRATSE